MADPKGLLVVPVAFRADGTIHALELDTSDRLKVIIDAVTGNITVDGQSPSIFRPISSPIFYQNLVLAAGTNTLSIYTIPASQGFRLTTWSMAYVGTVAGVTIQGAVVNGADNVRFASQVAPVSGQLFPSVVDVLLTAGMILTANVFGATLNDDFYASIHLQRIF